MRLNRTGARIWLCLQLTASIGMILLSGAALLMGEWHWQLPMMILLGIAMMVSGIREYRSTIWQTFRLCISLDPDLREADYQEFTKELLMAGLNWSRGRVEIFERGRLVYKSSDPKPEQKAALLSWLNTHPLVRDLRQE